MRVGVVCPRQNGKNALIEARILAGLFIFGEQLIVYSAHLADTADEMFRRLEELIESVPWLASQVAHYWRANGKAAIELHSGQRVKFKTRTASGGRGLSGDVVFFDEAMVFPEAAHAAVFPIISTRPNPQVWYTGSAVDQTVHDHGRVLTGVREGALSGESDSLAYFEWSVDLNDPAELTPEQSLDEALLARANPAKGRRITMDYLRQEQEAFRYDLRSFAVERFGIGDWPRLDLVAGAPIPIEAWEALVDPESRFVGKTCFAFDVQPERAFSSIAAAGVREDGLGHVEVIERRRGTSWVAGRLAELVAKHENIGVLYAAGSPAASLAPDLDDLKIEATALTSGEHAQACGHLYDDVMDMKLRHLGSTELLSAVGGAVKRPLGDAWAWNRKDSTVDISPLVAATLANWGASTLKPKSVLLMPPVFV